MNEPPDPQTPPVQVSVKNVIREKSPAISRLIPGFVIAYLRRVIHEDELNAFLRKHQGKEGFEFMDAIIDHFELKIKVCGLTYIKPHERVIVASNHPLGGLDGIALMHTLGTVRPDIIFPVNDILMAVKAISRFFVPINKHGSNAENVKIINDTFASDKLICYFPFGLVSRKKKGKIKDLEWKPTLIKKARRFKRDIIPTHISGRNSNFFYNLSNVRKAFGIGMNLEMLYLVDEMTKHQGKEITITFGKKIPHTVFDRSRSDAAWAEELRKYVYLLADKPDLEFEP